MKLFFYLAFIIVLAGCSSTPQEQTQVATPAQETAPPALSIIDKNYVPPYKTYSVEEQEPEPAGPIRRDPVVEEPVYEEPVYEEPEIEEPEYVAPVHYANCSDVRAHGAAPIYPGEPGFQSKFDRDKDGVGCE